MDIRYFSYLAQNNSIWIELLTKIFDIKSYNYGTPKRYQWEKTQISLYKTQIKLLRVNQLQEFGGDIILAVKNILLIFGSALLVIKGEMTLGMMIAVQYIIGQLKMPLYNIVQSIISALLAHISFVRVTDSYIRRAQER